MRIYWPSHIGWDEYKRAMDTAWMHMQGNLWE